MSSRKLGFRVFLTVGVLLKNVSAFAPNHYQYNQRGQFDVASGTNSIRDQTNVLKKICFNYKPSNHGTSSCLYSETGKSGSQKILNEDDEDDDFQIEIPKETLYSKSVLDGGASIIDIELKEHKPLGCTVDESLAPQEDDSFPVFISKITTDGNAEKAGLVVGDVIIAITGIFDDLEDTSGAGLERVRQLISGRYADKPLQIRVLRGTDVMARHEEHLVSLCNLPGGTDDDLKDCLNAIMTDEKIEDDVVMDCDEEGECMLDAMFEAWGDELTENVTPSPTKEKQSEIEIEINKKKNNARPWASRSSPSGTYVRDPTTGKMKNIG